MRIRIWCPHVNKLYAALVEWKVRSKVDLHLEEDIGRSACDRKWSAVAALVFARNGVLPPIDTALVNFDQLEFATEG